MSHRIQGMMGHVTIHRDIIKVARTNIFLHSTSANIANRKCITASYCERSPKVKAMKATRSNSKSRHRVKKSDRSNRPSSHLQRAAPTMDFVGNPFGKINGPVPTFEGGKKATQTPITTGTSVLGITFDGGVLLAADMLGSYGSLARYRNVERLVKVNEKTVLAVGGDIADFQHIKAVIEERVLEEDMLNDGFEYSPKALHSWLTRVLYTRRSKFNPLWNTCVVGGLQSGEPYLGYVNMIGVNYTADCMSTGFGGHLGVPQLREALESKDGPLTLEEARQAMDRVLHILYYRDCRAYAEYQLAIVDASGARIEKPAKLTGNWELANYVRGYE